MRLTTALLLALLGCGISARLAAKPVEPRINWLYPAGGQRGTTVTATVSGANLTGASAVRLAPGHLTGQITKLTGATAAALTITLPADAEPGEYDLRLLTPLGLTNRFRFLVSTLPEVVEAEPNSTVATAQRLPALPLLVNGQVMDHDRDYFRFAAHGGQTLVADVQARAILPFIADAVPGWFDPVVTLYDAQGRQVALADDSRIGPDPLLAFTPPADGDYVLEVRDVIYRGRGDFVYRVSLGALPRLTRLQPLGAPAGRTAKVKLFGYNLPQPLLELPLPADSPPFRPLSVTADGQTSNALTFAVATERQVSEVEPNGTRATANRLVPPLVVEGCIGQLGDMDWFTVHAAAGEKLVFDVLARRLGSPLDSVLTLYDANGGRMAENDDSIDPAWPLLCFQADSRLMATFPTAGDYHVRLRDAQGHGGEDYGYRLRVGPAKPDYLLRATPDNPVAAAGDCALLTIAATRFDGLNEDIVLHAEGLPPGFVSSSATLGPKDEAVGLTISAPADAQPTLFAPTVVGTATLDGAALTRPALGAEPAMQAFAYKHSPTTREFAVSVLPAGPFTLSWAQPPGALDLKPGASAELQVKVVRAAGETQPVQLRLALPIPGLTWRGVTIPTGSTQATFSVSVPAQATSPVKTNLIVQGVRKVGEDEVVRTLPAVPLTVTIPPAPPKTP